MNPLVIEIKNLFELIEEKENEHLALMNDQSNAALRRTETDIELLKQRLQTLEDLLYDDSLPKK